MAIDKKLDLSAIINDRKPAQTEIAPQKSLGSILDAGKKSLEPDQLSVASREALLIASPEEAEIARQIHMRVFHGIRSVLAGGMAIKITNRDSSLAGVTGGRDFRDAEIKFIERIGLFSNYEILQLGMPFFLEEVQNFRAIPGDNEKPLDPTTDDNMMRFVCVKDMIERHTGNELQGEDLDRQAKEIFTVIAAATDKEIDEVKDKVSKETLTIEEQEQLSTTEVKTLLDILSAISAMMFGKAQSLTLLVDVVNGVECFYKVKAKNPVEAMKFHEEALELLRELEPSLRDNLRDFASSFGDTQKINIKTASGDAVLNTKLIDEIVNDPARVFEIATNEPEFDSSVVAKMKDLERLYTEIANDHSVVKKSLDRVESMHVIDNPNKAIKVAIQDIGRVAPIKRKKIDEGIKKRLTDSEAICTLYELFQRAHDGVSESVFVSEVATGFNGLEGDNLAKHGFKGLSSLTSLYGRLDRFIGSARVLRDYLAEVKRDFDEQAAREKPQTEGFTSAAREKAEILKNTGEYIDAAHKLAAALFDKFSSLQKATKDVYEEGKGNVDMQTFALVNLALISVDLKALGEFMSKRQDQYAKIQTERPAKS